MTMSNLGGRPRTIETPEEFEELAGAYMLACKASGDKPTITGMALEMGLWGRDAFLDYAARDGFSNAVKRAKSRVEMLHEQRLFEPSCAGSIFWLKNAGWKDTQDVTTNGTVVNRVEVTIVDPAN